MLNPADLCAALGRQTELALSSGALQPLPTRSELVEDAGVEFVLRTLEAVEQKQLASGNQRTNPFLPYDRAMFVADVSETHVALLNKYNVIEQHLLIVTRAFEDQQAPLTLADFEALWSCMAGLRGLGFYNGGPEAGASQPHKHLQLVPLPLVHGGAGVPVDSCLADVGSVPTPAGRLPFRHIAARLDDAATGAGCHALYERMIDMLDAAGRPHNLLVTREWMICVPRTRECFESVSVNALGFAGSLFVRNSQELQRIKDVGPMSVLRDVGVPL